MSSPNSATSSPGTIAPGRKLAEFTISNGATAAGAAGLNRATNASQQTNCPKAEGEPANEQSMPSERCVCGAVAVAGSTAELVRPPTYTEPSGASAIAPPLSVPLDPKYV